MAEAERGFTPYIKIGYGFFRFINGELNSGKQTRINRGIVLLHMIERANRIPNKEYFVTIGKRKCRVEYGVCLVSENEIKKACKLSGRQPARTVLEWLENNGHIERTYPLTARQTDGSYYIVKGITNPELYAEYEKITKEEDAKSADNTGIIEDNGEGNQPSTPKKQPNADDEKSACLSTFSDDGGGENNQYNIIGFPVGNSDISVDKSYTGPKTQSRANFEQFKTSQFLEDYILSVTHHSRGRNKYICPFCGSGTKKNKTGALSIDKRHGGTTWTCFSCDLHGDIFDFAGYLNGTTDKNEQLQIVAQFVNGKPLYYGKAEDPRQGIGS